MSLPLMTGDPPVAGPYVAFVNGDLKGVAERIILHWDTKHWWYPWSDQRYRRHVYGWVGPLPVLRLTEDQKKEKTE